MELHKVREWLTRLARRLTGKPADADNLVQDVLMKFIQWQQEPSFPTGDEARQRAWLATTMRNQFRTNLRKSVVRAGAATNPTLVDMTTSQPTDDSPGLMGSVSPLEFDQAMAGLTEIQRKTLELNQQGKSLAQIGQELGKTPGAIAKRLFDARERLRVTLKRIVASRTTGKK